uniref:hypothetical protein n=1 Tax=Bradyrhizobium sp. (strain ORS 278) TaxID=114615 RepID=UPI001FCB4CA7|nr:hypothetical protein [Bradyrhizobium sp. ORS 278]
MGVIVVRRESEGDPAGPAGQLCAAAVQVYAGPCCQPISLWGRMPLSNVTRIAVLALLLAGVSGPVSARGPYPVTECGPDLSSFCRLHGAFQATPFHYNLAIYPGCIRTVALETSRGPKYRRVVICGAPDRSVVR